MICDISTRPVCLRVHYSWIRWSRDLTLPRAAFLLLCVSRFLVDLIEGTELRFLVSLWSWPFVPGRWKVCAVHDIPRKASRLGGGACVSWYRWDGATGRDDLPLATRLHGVFPSFPPPLYFDVVSRYQTHLLPIDTGQKPPSDVWLQFWWI